MKRSLLFGCVCCFAVLAFSQEDPVLMHVNGRSISRSEFEYSYHRNAFGTGAALSPKEYAASFSQAMLKVAAAKVAGLDTTSAFREQHEASRMKLVESYLIDKLALDSCAHVLYQKMDWKHSGRVQIMQLFKYLPQTISSRNLEEQKSRMDSIYQTIRNQPGLDFARLVEKYSDDKESRWIESLQATSEFEEVAFSLSKGEISQPFFTPAGIHILKVTDRKEIPAYEEISDKLLERVQRGEMQDNLTGKVVERLKRDWQYIPNQTGIDELLENGETKQLLFTIDGQVYTGAMFKRFAASHPQAVKRQFNDFAAKSLLDYESCNIDKKHPEICYALQQSDDDYLVKEMIRRKVDLPAMNDRAGLATYFKFHSSDYHWDTPRYKGVVLHCADKKTAKQAKKMLKKLPEGEVDKLRQTFNTSGKERIQIEQGVFADGDNKYIDKLVFKKGGFEPDMSYPFTIIVGKKQKGPEDYREVIEQVRKDYRTYLDTYWTRELETSGKVEINQEVLKTVNNN